MVKEFLKMLAAPVEIRLPLFSVVCFAIIIVVDVIEFVMRRF